MNRILPSFLASVALGSSLPALADEEKETYTNPLLPNGADPWALWHDGEYFYMHTVGEKLVLWRTPDLGRLKDAARKTIWTPTDPSSAHNLWAPEIHRIDGKWYVYYAADDGNTDNHHLYVLENAHDDPFEGGFEMKGRLRTDKDDNWSIDGTLFEHRGKWYLFWSGWEKRRVDTETQCLYVARLRNPWTLDSDRVRISRPEFDWERHYLNPDGWTPDHAIYVNEGPQPLRSPDGRFVHLAYSASGCWTADYALGLLTARADADLLDPKSWKKSRQPVFRQSPENGVFGPGHNSFFKSPDGSEDFILYHARRTPAGKDARSPRMQRFHWKPDGTPDFGIPVPTSERLEKPSAH